MINSLVRVHYECTLVQCFFELKKKSFDVYDSTLGCPLVGQFRVLTNMQKYSKRTGRNGRFQFSSSSMKFSKVCICSYTTTKNTDITILVHNHEYSFVNSCLLFANSLLAKTRCDFAYDKSLDSSARSIFPKHRFRRAKTQLYTRCPTSREIPVKPLHIYKRPVYSKVIVIFFLHFSFLFDTGAMSTGRLIWCTGHSGLLAIHTHTCTKFLTRS